MIDWFLPMIVVVLAAVGTVALCVLLAMLIKRLRSKRYQRPTPVARYPSSLPTSKIRQLRNGR
jgi:membrane protein implicated in regulation of membrane protease activity